MYTHTLSHTHTHSHTLTHTHTHSHTLSLSLHVRFSHQTDVKSEDFFTDLNGFQLRCGCQL